jgi:hypothetical protein
MNQLRLAANPTGCPVESAAFGEGAVGERRRSNRFATWKRAATPLPPAKPGFPQLPRATKQGFYRYAVTGKSAGNCGVKFISPHW